VGEESRRGKMERVGDPVNNLIGVVPARGLCYIKHIQTAETYANSPIIITDKSRDAISKQQFEIVALGKYEICEDVEECVRHHNKWNQHVHRLMCGDWVLVKNRAWLATPDPDVFVVRQDAILGKFVER
jgi:hypothetical protein